MKFKIESPEMPLCDLPEKHADDLDSRVLLEMIDSQSESTVRDYLHAWERLSGDTADQHYYWEFMTKEARDDFASGNMYYIYQGTTANEEN